ncbi:MAG: chorismate mutase [Oscillospiraceae bacterium]|nr:chorismate mutase [Oscillospiraceae bacterium]
MDLTDHRQELDKIDRELTGLFLRRMEICGEIGDWKRAEGRPILDAKREQEVLTALSALCPPYRQGELRALYGEIFALSRESQRRRTTSLRCGLLGEKLGHSYSPQIHGMLAGYRYELFERAPADVASFVREGDWDGLNVTIPYKKTVLPLCDDLSETAREIGSVNTLIRRPDGGVYGDNTDAYGFELLLRRLGVDVAGKKALVLGSGGASAAVCWVLRKHGASPVIVVSRSGEDSYADLDRHADARLIVNATPVGMYPRNGESLIDLRRFPACEGVLELIYDPARTALLLQAERLHIPHANGLFMLVAQALRSAEQFVSHAMDEGQIERIEGVLSRQTENIVLVGMPGCGKSEIARRLGEILQRPVLDADKEIGKAAGMSIPEIFASEGEEGFRRRETEVLRELGKRSGMVLSTGGGCVTREENYDLLHQNGRIVWRQRAVEKLARSGRPISLSRDLYEIYAEREPLYRRFADHIIEETDTVEEAVEKILEVLG